jgi:hypothetical protein
MQFLQAWAESLTLFKPVNLKPLLLITLKSIVETYKVLFTKFWPVILVSLALDISAFYVLTKLPMPAFQVTSGWIVFLWVTIFVGAMIALMALCMTIFLTARPSVALKDWRYLFGYWRHFIYFFFAWFIAMVCKNIFLILFVYWIFFAVFLLDSDGRLKSFVLSFWRALKIMGYNLPFVLISCLVFKLLFLPITMFLGVHISTMPLSEFIMKFCVVNLIQLPLLICFYMNFYIKAIREQFNLYFMVKGQ